MKQPSSTISAAAIAAFIGSTSLLVVKLVWPDIYVQVPPEYQGYLVGALSAAFGYIKKENVLDVKR